MISPFLGTPINVSSEKIHVLSKKICKKTILGSQPSRPSTGDISCPMSRRCWKILQFHTEQHWGNLRVADVKFPKYLSFPLVQASWEQVSPTDLNSKTVPVIQQVPLEWEMSLWPTRSSKANSCSTKHCSRKNCGHLSPHAFAIEQPRLCFQHFRNSLPNHHAVTKWKPLFSGVANTIRRKLQSALKFRVTPERMHSSSPHTPGQN